MPNAEPTGAPASDRTPPAPAAAGEAGPAEAPEAGAAPAAPAPDGSAIDRHAWVAPFLGTLLAGLGALAGYVYAGLAPMACDSCNGARLHRFDTSFEQAYAVYRYGLLVPLVLLLAAWGMSRERRNAARRVACALLAPLCVVVLVVLFAALVDWPE
jgi:hypothetical protein